MTQALSASDRVDLRLLTAAAKAKMLGKATPLYVIFEVTHLCNLSCVYCDRHTPLPSEMNFEQISRVIDDFVKIGMIGMTLDGGDPLTRKDIDKMINKLASLNLRIVINTNGILVPQKIEIVKKASLINVSLDGPEEYNDCMRGKGSFQKAVEGVRRAREAGVPVGLRCTIHKHNLKSVPELVRLAQELDSPIYFQPALNSMFLDTPRDGSAWELPSEEFRQIILWLIKEKARNRYIENHYASLKHYLYFPFGKETPCSAGWIHVTMDPEGYLYHCGQVNREPQKINVLQYGVEEAFRRIARYSCDQCWCGSLVDTNYAWGLQLGQFTRNGIKKILNKVKEIEATTPVISSPVYRTQRRTTLELPVLNRY